MSDIADVGSYLPVAANAVTNVSLHSVYADNATVGTSYELVTNLDADISQLGTAGDGIEFVGSSTDDDGSPAGTGANTVTVKGLDTSFNIKEATITMNGTTVVEQGDTTWTFINEAFVASAGTGLEAAGAISVTNDASANTIALIDQGKYKMASAWWKVPAGHTGYVFGFWGNTTPTGTSAGVVTFALQMARHGLQGLATNDGSHEWETIVEMNVGEHDSDIAQTVTTDSPGVFSFPGNIPLVIPPKAIVRLAAKAFSGTVGVSGGFHIIVQGSGSGTTVTES